MAAATISDEALLAALRAHPQLRDRIASMIGVLLEGDSAFKEADAAEAFLFDETRLLGRDVLRGWAERRIVETGQEASRQPGVRRMGKKNCAGTANSAK